MQLNSKYFIHPDIADSVLNSLQQKVLSRIPRREISVEIVVDEYYYSPEDFVSLERIYKSKQLVNGELKGKPIRIRFKRETTNTTTYVDFGYTSMIDLRRCLEFLNYLPLGTLTQVRTGFFLRDELIELPVVLNETREFGCFVEVGETCGATSDIQALLDSLQRGIGLNDLQPVVETYPELLARVKKHREGAL